MSQFRTEFAADSPLEGTGFGLSVPREIGLGYEALSFICSAQKSWRSAEGTHSARGTSTATDVGRASQEGGLRFGLCRDRQGTRPHHSAGRPRDGRLGDRLMRR